MLVLRHGEFLGEEVRRATAAEFHVTFRKSKSGVCDAELHQHDTPTIVLPLDDGYCSDAIAFDANCALQLVYTPAGTIHRDSMARLGGRYLCVSMSARATRGVEGPFSNPVALKRLSVHRIAHVLALQILRGNDDLLTIEDACWRLVSQLSVPDYRYKPVWIDNVLSYCRDNLDRPIKLAEIGQATGLHPAHISRAFRIVFGQSLSRYIAYLRLEMAASELRRSKASIAAIAAKAGYSDQSHLCRVFRSEFKIPPSSYRAAFS